MEERKFVCKYCSKRFPCGKSLGGHIRTHMSSEHLVQVQLQSNEKERINAAAMFKRKRDLNLGSGGGDDLSYGLRENPKKTTRFVHSNANTSQMEKFCKECGKGFPSLKALCGHMACHSEKDKGTTNRLFENNYSASGGVTEKQKLVLDDSQSDTETSVPMNPRRSKRMRFKQINNNNNNHQPPSSSSLPFPIGSSSVSEVEQDQEEVARCLMLLSKDSSYKGRFGLVTDSSDNNSVVLEAKSPSPMKYGKNSLTSGYELMEKKLHKDVKLKMKMKTDEIGYDSDNSDSGYFRYGPKKVDSDDSSDEFCRNEVKSSKVGYFSGFEDHGFESRKMASRGRSRNSEFKKLVLEGNDFDSRKRPNYGSMGQNLVVGGSSRKTVKGFGNGGEIYEHGGKGWKLKSERDNGSDDSAYESDENSIDTDSYPAPKTQSSSRNLSGKIKKSSKGKKKKLKSKKSKEHECPICNKIFRSGQALGGHKRSHFIGGSEENTLVIRPSAPPPPPPLAVVPCLIDLNLPAPVDE